MLVLQQFPKDFLFSQAQRDGRPETEDGSSKIMDGKFKFENLVIWKKAVDYGEMIFTLSKQFPKDELYNLTSQIHRAADSISLNISEGSIGQSDPEQKRFMGIAIRSLAEVATCLHKALRRKYISQSEFNDSYEYAFNLMNMMIALKTKFNDTKSKSSFFLPSSVFRLPSI